MVLLLFGWLIMLSQGRCRTIHLYDVIAQILMPMLYLRPMPRYASPG
jgi:hypothetical protein